MKITESISKMQQTALKWRESGAKIALVPTMGYLHEGHLSLMREARRLVGKKGKVVTSIYVNPTQFGPNEDYSRYPRDLKSDKKLCLDVGVDLLFLPNNESMYPRSSSDLEYSTFVTENQLSTNMEGASRPGHFQGVTTVVAKLFLITQPHYAVFGAKDFQQARVIEKMTTDLNFPVQIKISPTSRDSDGLALSSRNKYLSPEERKQAPEIWNAISAAREWIQSSPDKTGSAAVLRKQLLKQINSRSDFKVDYIEFFDPVTLVTQKKISPQSRIALAARLGNVRLIDNASLDPDSDY